MSALLWKELRENFRWALLAFVALTAAELYVLQYRRYPEQIDFNFNAGITVTKSLFLTVTLFSSAALGLALGLWQVLPELKRDRWAALLHRPIERGRFFWGKAGAGSLLYLFAVGGPLLICTWRVATPGHYDAPFRLAMLQPSVANLLLGLAFYYAGLLMALEGKRTALRVLPLLAAFHVAFFALAEKKFLVAVEASLALTLVLAIAGWGALRVPAWSRRPWQARLALLIVAFYGACGAGDVLKLGGRFAGRMGPSRWEVWQVLENGAPARMTYEDQLLVATHDAAGQPFAEPEFGPSRVQSHTLGMNLATWTFDRTVPPESNFYEWGYRETHSYLWSLRPFSHLQTEQWFYDAKARAFIGFLPDEKRTFAMLGRDGFAAGEARVPGFSKQLAFHQMESDTLLLSTGEALHLIDLRRQTDRPLPLPAPGPIYGTGYCWARSETESAEHVGVALGAGVAYYDRKGAMLALVPYRHDVAKWGEINVGILKHPDRFVIQAEPSRNLSREERKTMSVFVDITNAQGDVVAAHTLPPLGFGSQPPAWSDYIAQRLQSPAFFFGKMLGRKEAATAQQWRERRAALFVLLPLALVLAAGTLRWALRAQMPTRQAWAWAAGVFAFGLAGLIVFWLAGERPRTTACPACARPRRLADEHCAHCGAAWPSPALEGTEILDPLPAPALPATT